MDDLAKQSWADAIRYGFQRNVLRGVKIARQIFIVPTVLSVAYVIGFIVAWISDPQRPTSDALFDAALNFYLFFGSLAFIPFLVIASIAKKRVSNDEYKIYEIRGSVVGLSLVALAYFFYLGLMAAGAPHERGARAVDTAAVFAFLAAIVGIVFAFIGRVVGFYYGDSQKHKRQNSRLDWHPKNLCW